MVDSPSHVHSSCNSSSGAEPYVNFFIKSSDKLTSPLICNLLRHFFIKSSSKLMPPLICNFLRDLRFTCLERTRTSIKGCWQLELLYWFTCKNIIKWWSVVEDVCRTSTCGLSQPSPNSLKCGRSVQPLQFKSIKVEHLPLCKDKVNELYEFRIISKINRVECERGGIRPKTIPAFQQCRRANNDLLCCQERQDMMENWIQQQAYAVCTCHVCNFCNNPKRG